MSAYAVPLREDVPHVAPSAAVRRRVVPEMRRTLPLRAAKAGVAQPVEDELVRAFARNHLRALPHHLLLMLALALVAATWMPVWAIFPAAGVVATIILAEGIVSRWLVRQPADGLAAASWRRGFVLAGLGQGLGWLAFALPFLTNAAGAPDGRSSDAFLLIAVLLLSGAAAFVRAPLPRAVWAILAPLGLVLALSAAGGPDRTHAMLALLVLSGQIFLAYVAHRLHRTAAANVRTRARIRASFAALERIRASTSEVCRRAEEADRAKAQFFANVSHELRTPLNAILGFSELMKNEVLGVHSTPSYREYSSDIHGSGQQLLELIDGILDLSRIASGQYVLDVRTVDLRDAVRESIDSLAASARPKGHRIALEVAPDLEPIAVDPTAVRQMVSNLVSNAVKFTAPGGEIAVRVGWTSRGGQYVSVTDNGPGIPVDEIRVALSSFGRGSRAVSTAEPGVGLGLPIVRGLAELHGGRLTLSAAVPRGTEAVVIFPAHRCESARSGGTRDATAA